MSSPVYAAYLRVYEPLAAFGETEQKHWRTHLDDGLCLDRSTAAALEHRLGVRAVVAMPPVPNVEDDDAAVVVVQDGVPYICPLDLRLRSWEAVAEFRDLLPDSVSEAFLPLPSQTALMEEYERFRRANPDRRAHVQSARWQVPLRWFVAFDPVERHLEPPETAGSVPSLTYRTAMSRARRRVARTLAVLHRTLEDGPVVEGVEQLGRWLEEFHPHSLVELDYGGLAGFVDGEVLRDDQSAGDVAEAVRAIGRGDVTAAGAAYERVVTRWRALAALEAAN